MCTVARLSDDVTRALQKKEKRKKKKRKKRKTFRFSIREEILRSWINENSLLLNTYQLHQFVYMNERFCKQQKFNNRMHLGKSNFLGAKRNDKLVYVKVHSC